MCREFEKGDRIKRVMIGGHEDWEGINPRGVVWSVDGGAGTFTVRFDGVDYGRTDWNAHSEYRTDNGFYDNPDAPCKIVHAVPDGCWMDVFGVVHKEATV